MTGFAVATLLQASLLAAGGSTYADAWKQMDETGCPLVVLVGAEWCPACQAMKTSVIPELQKSGGLGQVAFAVVDYDRETAVARKLMKGSSIPQLVMFHKTDTGWSRTQLTGRQSVEAVATFVRGGVDAVAALAAKPQVAAASQTGK